MPRTTSEAALALLKNFEQGPDGGFASMIYRCPAGHPTIGWGHVVGPAESFPQPITRQEADRLLRADLERFAGPLAAALRNCPDLTQSMFDALVCFAFNVGLGAALGSTLMSRVKQQNWSGAADEFPKWNKAMNPKTGKKEPLDGLTSRRQAERDLFLRDGLPD